MGKVKRPTLSVKLVKKTICKMTGLDYDTVNSVLDTYAELMYKTIMSGIEFQLPKVGIIGFYEIPPKPEGMYHNAFLKKKVMYPARPGYLKIKFREGTRVKDKLKASTLFGEGLRGEEYRDFLNSLYECEWGKPMAHWDGANETKFDHQDDNNELGENDDA